MNCPTCQAPNWDQARFCQGCGAALAQAAPPMAPPAPSWQQPAPSPQQGYQGQPAYTPPQQGWGPPQPPPQQQAWQGQHQGWSPPQQPQQGWGGQSAWGTASPMGVGINWQAVGYGAAAYCIAVSLYVMTMTAYTAPIFAFLTVIGLAACGGSVTVQYSPSRSVIEGALAGVVGNIAAVMVLSMMLPYYRADLGSILLSSLLAAAGAAWGAHWYAGHLRQKGK